MLVKLVWRCSAVVISGATKLSEMFQFVWVTDRLRFGGCLRWFVGKGLDPSTGDNARPVRGVEDAVPYI